jgi:hypothetical protein
MTDRFAFSSNAELRIVPEQAHSLDDAECHAATVRNSVEHIGWNAGDFADPVLASTDYRRFVVALDNEAVANLERGPTVDVGVHRALLARKLYVEQTRHFHTVEAFIPTLAPRAARLLANEVNAH